MERKAETCFHQNWKRIDENEKEEYQVELGSHKNEEGATVEEDNVDYFEEIAPAEAVEYFYRRD